MIQTVEIQTVEKIYWNNVFNGYRMTMNDGKIWVVPLDEKNTDYREIQKWIADGGTVIDNPPE